MCFIDTGDKGTGNYKDKIIRQGIDLLDFNYSFLLIKEED
jgi:hypothetical protein